MIKPFQIFALAPLLPLCASAPAASAEDPVSLPAIQATYSGCIASVDASPHYAPLAAHGFLQPPAGYSESQLTDQNFATAAEARLVADFQAAAQKCEVALRIDLENLDPALADLASQSRQLTDVNELLLIDGKESWGDFSANRRQIDASVQQASLVATAEVTAGQSGDTQEK